jgi:hypothetical protein
MGRDIDLRGRVLKRLDDESVIFEDEATGKRVKLPREDIAIVEEVEGVTLSLPYGLARAKGLA